MELQLNQSIKPCDKIAPDDAFCAILIICLRKNGVTSKPDEVNIAAKQALGGRRSQRSTEVVQMYQLSHCKMTC